MRRLVTLAAIVLGATVSVAAARAQDPDPRLASRLDPATRKTVQALADSVIKLGLPAEPIYDRAFEGSVKGIAPDRIVSAVRSLAMQLGAAREALTPVSDSNEIKAGAMALQAGIPAPALTRVRRAAPARRLTAMLTVLADLVTRRVPEASATDVIVSLASASVSDPELEIFQRDLRSDLASGADPRTAAITRARGILAQRQSMPHTSAGIHAPDVTVNRFR